MWQNCVRYAIEAGEISIRVDDPANYANNEDSVDLSLLFDVDDFIKAFRQVCPQMRIVASDNDIPDLPPPTSDRSPHLYPTHINSVPTRQSLFADPSGWRRDFDQWLASLINLGSKMSTEAPVRVWQAPILTSARST
ncbi:hypothetical protein SEUCBS139899_005411 [Sporothrix eucalyptigena]